MFLGPEKALTSPGAGGQEVGPGGSLRRNPEAGAGKSPAPKPSPRSAHGSGTPERAKMEPRFDVSPSGRRRAAAPRRGRGQGQPPGRPQRPPCRLLRPRQPLLASPLPQGFWQNGAAALAVLLHRNAPLRPRKALRARAWPLPPPAAPGPGRCRGGRRAPATFAVPATPAGALRRE